MTFSVVIPVYKVEEYLDECVQSVLSQTYSDLEVILVDDGSPDRCGQMCDDWVKRDERVRVIHQKNAGAAAARNVGIREATGDYLMFLDSDDWWENATVLEAIARQLKRTPVDVLTFNYRKSYDGALQPPYFDKKLISSTEPESLTQIVRQDRWVSGACNKAVSRKLFAENDMYFYVGITAEDIDWPLRLALKAETFGFCNVSVFVYRQLITSASHSASLKKMQTLCNNIKTCVRLLEQTDEVRAAALKPYVAYQYGTLLFNVADLSGSDKRSLMTDLKEMAYLLKYSDNPKIRLIYKSKCLLGMFGTLVLLKLRCWLLKYNGKGI